MPRKYKLGPLVAKREEREESTRVTFAQSYMPAPIREAACGNCVRNETTGRKMVSQRGQKSIPTHRDR